MADYSDAATNAAENAEELIEEYEITPRGMRVRRGSTATQLQTALLLEGLAARRGGIAVHKLAKIRAPR